MFKIDAQYVYLLKDFVSKEDSMDAIACISVEPADCGGAYVVALNGHCFAMFHDKDAEIDEAYVFKPSKALFSACRRTKKTIGAIVEGNDQKGRIKVMIGPSEIYVEPGNPFRAWQYPNWKNFVSLHKKAKPFPTCLPSDTFSRFNFPNNNGHRSLHIHTTGKESPVFVLNRAYPEFLGIFMPMLDPEDAALTMPDWLPTFEEAQE